MSPEAKFYKDHYARGAGVGATPLEVFAREMLASGKRYGLVAEHLLRPGRAGGCLAEIGCGGGEALLILSEKARRFDPDRRCRYRIGSVMRTARRAGRCRILKR